MVGCSHDDFQSPLDMYGGDLYRHPGATPIVSNVSVEETARISLEAQLTVNSWHKSCQGTLLFVHRMSQVNSTGYARGNGATTRIRPGRHYCSKPSLDLEWLKVVVEGSG